MEPTISSISTSAAMACSVIQINGLHSKMGQTAHKPVGCIRLAIEPQPSAIFAPHHLGIW
ncbi:MAG: hypothetical protein IPP37_05620 [Saprospiraceae bacterium]|nr:hypothetical protein [Saprospiraceae bacterium]